MIAARRYTRVTRQSLGKSLGNSLGKTLEMSLDLLLDSGGSVALSSVVIAREGGRFVFRSCRIARSSLAMTSNTELFAMWISDGHHAIASARETDRSACGNGGVGCFAAIVSRNDDVSLRLRQRPKPRQQL